MSEAETDATAENPGSVPEMTTPLVERRVWSSVAKKDVSDATRSWQIYVLLGVFATLLAFGALTPALRQVMVGSEQPLSASTAIDSMVRLVTTFLPLVVLMVGHLPIVRERERGGLRVLLALPVSRRDLLVGTVLGRSAVVGGTLLGGLAVNGVAMVLLYDSLDIEAYAWFSTAVLAFALVFVGLAVGISAVSRERGRAMGAAIGTYLAVTYLWQLFLLIARVLTGVTPEMNIQAKDVAPGWYVLLNRIQPSKAWQFVLSDWVAPRTPGMDITAPAPYTTPGPEPFYLDTWFLAIVLLAWGAIPLLVGYWRFRGADIG